MLVLSRKQGEALELPEIGVAVEVVSLKKSKVQLGIQAPQEITVLRREQTSGLHKSPGAQKYDFQRRAERERCIQTLEQIEADLAQLSNLADQTDMVALRAIVGNAADKLADLRGMIGPLDRATPFANPSADTLGVHQPTMDADEHRELNANSSTVVRQSKAAYQIGPRLSLQHVA